MEKEKHIDYTTNIMMKRYSYLKVPRDSMRSEVARLYSDRDNNFTETFNKKMISKINRLIEKGNMVKLVNMYIIEEGINEDNILNVLNFFKSIKYSPSIDEYINLINNIKILDKGLTKLVDNGYLKDKRKYRFNYIANLIEAYCDINHIYIEKEKPKKKKKIIRSELNKFINYNINKKRIKVKNFYEYIRQDFYSNRKYSEIKIKAPHDGSFTYKKREIIKPKEIERKGVEIDLIDIYRKMNRVFRKGVFNTVYLGSNKYQNLDLKTEDKYKKISYNNRLEMLKSRTLEIRKKKSLEELGCYVPEESDYLMNLENYFEIYTKDSIEKVINKRLAKDDIEALKDVFKYDINDIKPWYNINPLNLSRINRILDTNIRKILDKYADKKVKTR